MKTPDTIMKEQGLLVNWLKRYEPDTYNSIRRAMDEFAVQYAKWKIQKLNERQSSTDANKQHDSKALHIADVGSFPSEPEPVLAKIERINSLGKSTWYEVVYYYKYWRSYNGSTTFQDGEKVVNWRYCKDCW